VRELKKYLAGVANRGAFKKLVIARFKPPGILNGLQALNLPADRL
jgi:hypothetical protein